MKRDFTRIGNGHLSTEKRHPSDFDRGIYKKLKGVFMKKGYFPIRKEKGAHIIVKRVIIRGERGHLSHLKWGTDHT